MHNVIEALDGACLITLPLPFELNHVNVGLIRLEDGWMLIDSGLGDPQSFQALSEALHSHGVAWTDIRLVVATHMHPDHIGMMPRLLTLTGAKLAMHRVEAEHLQGVFDTGRPSWISQGLALAGTPAAALPKIERSLFDMRRTIGTLKPDILFEGGEAIPTALGPARIVWTPGHSPGHICLYWPDRKLLYSGDHIIESITPNIAWLPERDMLSEYLASLELVAPLDVDCILPSHGRPFTGHREWICETIQHHEERCGQLLAPLAAEGKTAHELVPSIWERQLSPFNYHFAVSEVLAHLEYLRRKGRVLAELTDGGSVTWRAA